MLTTGIIYLGYGLVSLILGIFPAGGTFPASLHNATQALGGYLHILDPLVPISTLLTCLTLVFSVEIALFGFKTFKWLVSHIPFIGGRGK